MKSIKGKSKRLAEGWGLVIFIAQYFLLLSIEIPRYIQIPLLSAVVLVIFYFLYSLFRLNTIMISTNGTVIFFALNGNFVFSAADITAVNTRYNFLSRILDCHILEIHQNDGMKKTIYLPDISEYEILLDHLNGYISAAKQQITANK